MIQAHLAAAEVRPSFSGATGSLPSTSSLMVRGRKSMRRSPRATADGRRLSRSAPRGGAARNFPSPSGTTRFGSTMSDGQVVPTRGDDSDNDVLDAPRDFDRRHPADRSADRSRVRLRRRTGCPRTPLRHPARWPRERDILRELLRPKRRRQSARHRPRTRSGGTRGDPLLERGGLLRRKSRPERSRSSKDHPNGGERADRRGSWSSTIGCADGSSDARDK